MPFAIESFDLSGFDTVFSISSSFGKGVITRPETRHICYLFSPTKYLWHEKQYYLSSRLPFMGISSYLRKWDYIAAQRPDEIYTLSRYSQRIIKSIYGRDSKILPPPFDIDYFKKVKAAAKRPKEKLLKDYFLFVGRLEPYKRVDLLINTFKKQKDNLLIVGTGSSKKKLVALANGAKNIGFMEDLGDNELAFVYQKARALLMPQSEDFGYTALESIFFETPVISLKNSGTAEIVKDGENGVLFYEQTKISLVEALEKFKTLSYNFDYRVVERFAKEHFLTKLKAIIN
jgi:glycosyltransferase involved in cell wall biosynthesis